MTNTGLIVTCKSHVGLIRFLQQAISETSFNIDLVYKFNRIVGRLFFWSCYSQALKWYNMDVMQVYIGYLFINPATDYRYGFHLNCLMVGQVLG